MKRLENKPSKETPRPSTVSLGDSTPTKEDSEMVYFVCFWLGMNLYTYQGEYSFGSSFHGQSGQVTWGPQFTAQCVEGGSDVIAVSNPDVIATMDAITDDDGLFPLFVRAESSEPAEGFALVDYATPVAAWAATH